MTKQANCFCNVMIFAPVFWDKHDTFCIEGGCYKTKLTIWANEGIGFSHNAMCCEGVNTV